MTAVIQYPSWGISGSQSPANWTNNLAALNAAGKKVAFIIPAPKTDTVAKIKFRAGSLSVSGDSDVRIETLSSGTPSGSLWGTNTNATVTINANGTFTATLTAGASVTVGQWLAVVIVNATGSYSIQAMSTTPANQLLSHCMTYDGSTWSKTQNSPIVALEYSNGSYEYIPGVLPFSGNGVYTAYKQDSTPDERGVKFTSDETGEASGAYFNVDIDGACDLVIYDSLDNVLSTTSIDPTIRQVNGQGIEYVVFSQTVTITRGGVYRMTLKSTTTTGGATVALGYLDVDTATVLAAMPGGVNFVGTSRTDGGAWTDETTRVPVMALYVRPSSGSSSVILLEAGMNGGVA